MLWGEPKGKQGTALLRHLGEPLRERDRAALNEMKRRQRLGFRNRRRPNKMQSPENLEERTLKELKFLASARGVVPVRLDGKSGPPRKSDYIAALT